MCNRERQKQRDTVGGNKLEKEKFNTAVVHPKNHLIFVPKVFLPASVGTLILQVEAKSHIRFIQCFINSDHTHNLLSHKSTVPSECHAHTKLTNKIGFCNMKMTADRSHLSMGFMRGSKVIRTHRYGQRHCCQGGCVCS